MKVALRGFLLTFAGEAIIALASWIPRRQIADFHSALVTIIWASLFACGAGLVIGLNYPLTGLTARHARPISIAVSVVLAILAYVAAFLITSGTIAGSKFPLLLIFLGGATFAIVSIFWRGGVVSGVLSLGAVVLIGAGLSTAPYLAMRRAPTYITVVKYNPDNTAQLEIVSLPGTEISEFDKSALAGLKLHGILEINRTFSLGPASSDPRHMIIILTHPILASTELSEPKTDIIYFQDGNEWRKLPADSKVTFRKVELYPIRGDCMAVAVWNSLGQHSATSGPCWH